MWHTHQAGRFFDMVRSMVEHEIKPANMVSLISEIDLTEIEAIRKDPQGFRPSYTAFVVKALALAMKECSYANRRIYSLPWWPFGNRFQQFSTSDVSVACEKDEPGIEVAMFTDVIRNAEDRSLREVTDWLRALAQSTPETNQRWKDFKWLGTRVPRFFARWITRLPCYFPKLWALHRGGAAMVSSPAKYGVDILTTSWQATLGVSFGYVKERAVVINGKVVARPTFYLLLNFDRRVMAGAQGARFFKQICDLLHNPHLLLADDSAKGTVEEAPPLSLIPSRKSQKNTQVATAG